MLTRLRVKNFKQFHEIDIELGQTVVLIGPNNSGKTTALQALALWHDALEAWTSRVDQHISPPYAELDTTATLNRLGLTAIPVPSTQLLWTDMKATNGEKIRMEITVDGINDGETWSHGYDFFFANEESVYCEQNTAHHYSFYIDTAPKIVFLPSMSGLTSTEPRLEPGRINVLIGEGRTAEVLRNLCFQVHEEGRHWQPFVDHLRRMFGVELLTPQYLAARGELRMAYKTANGIGLDIAASGRGMHQIMLLLAYMYLNPGAVLLLDEPDAHLEILRQREIYHLLTSVARQQGAQIIAASHSEIVLEEAADRDLVVAFIGRPHTINKPHQVVKALRDIPFDHYYQAEQKGWVLYLEGATDLAILRAFADKLKHPASSALERVFVHPIDTNQPQKVRDHFYGLREAKGDLVGIAIFDRLSKKLGSDAELDLRMWRKREIENYLCLPQVLLAYARQGEEGDAADARAQIMQTAINDLINALKLLNRPEPFSDDIKASDEFLEPLFTQYYQKLGLPNLMLKTNFHRLANFIEPNQIAPEVIEKLDAIFETARRAKPRKE